MAALFALALGAAASAVQAQTGSVYYVCPGNIFTNTISAKEAESKGCKPREVQQPTSVPAPKPRPASTGTAAPSSAPRPAESRIDTSEQKARDTDARRILEAELRKEEEKLEALRREYNNGEPERRGEERNSQKYADRVAEMKAAIQRKEADLAAIRREMGKLGQ
ncbi:MAG: hypothetical protein C4K60_16830 [Ideonella sp. MAG2]|nr:MAG: hypothetical protein C4K60_16830 [Ideonella sp. MAG2]